MKEIKLYGVISNEGFLGMGENGYIERIANEIKDAGDKDINLRINTPGGSVFDGFAIITNLLEHKGKINMQVDGFAASMGGAILAYADHATAYDYAYVMLHKVSSYCDDEETKKFVDRLNNDFANMFKGKGIDSELIDEIFLGDGNKDYWFSAQEAENIGFINEVFESNVEQKAAASSRDMISDYYKILNQKREVVMFNSKEELKTVKADIVDLLKNINSFITKDEVIALTKEENEKVTETINEDNQKKFDEMNEESEKTSTALSEVTEKLQKLTESIDNLEESNTENTTKLTELEKKIDATITAIKGVVTDFVVPATVDGHEQQDKSLTGDKLNIHISNEINKPKMEKK